MLCLSRIIWNNTCKIPESGNFVNMISHLLNLSVTSTSMFFFFYYDTFPTLFLLFLEWNYWEHIFSFWELLLPFFLYTQKKWPWNSPTHHQTLFIKQCLESIWFFLSDLVLFIYLPSLLKRELADICQVDSVLYLKTTKRTLILLSVLFILKICLGNKNRVREISHYIMRYCASIRTTIWFPKPHIKKK